MPTIDDAVTMPTAANGARRPWLCRHGTPGPWLGLWST